MTSSAGMIAEYNHARLRKQGRPSEIMGEPFEGRGGWEFTFAQDRLASRAHDRQLHQ